MRTLPILSLIAICLLLSFCPPKPGTGKITVKIEGLPTKGAFAIALFKSADGFPFNLNKAYRVKHFGIPVAPDSIRFDNVPFGTYAVSVKWDEFYVQPDTIRAAYNHMQGFTTSGKSGIHFDSSSFVFCQKRKTVTVGQLQTY